MLRSRLLQETEQILQQLDSNRLKASYIDAIILFGSRARQSHSKHSDFDLLVIGYLPKSWNILERRRYIQRILFESVPFIGDILTSTSEEFLSAMEDNRGITLDIALDGKPIYDPSDFFLFIKQKINEKIQQGLRRGEHYWYWEK